MPSTKRLASILRMLLGIAIVGLAVVAAFFESQTLLEYVPQNLQTPVFVAMICAVTGLIWATALIIVRKIGNSMFRARLKSGAFSTLIGAIVYSLMTAPLVLVYIIGWRFLKQTGHFPGWEVLKVAALKEYPSWLKLAELSPAQQELLTQCGILVGGILPGLYILSSIAAGVETKRLKDAVAKLWLLCAIVVMGGSLYYLQFAPPADRDVQVAHLTKATSPVVALGMSAWESFVHEPIEPVLGEEDLVSQDTNWSASSSGRKPSIIFVAVESLRHDVVHLSYQGREVTPNLNKLAKNGIQWKRAYAQSTFSDYSDACIVSSLYPLRSRTRYVHGANQRFPATRIYDLLKPVGYATGVFSSRNESAGGTDLFYRSENLDTLHHADAAFDQSSVEQVALDDGAGENARSDELPEDGPEEELVADDQASTQPTGVAVNADAEATATDATITDKAIAWIEARQAERTPFFVNVSLNSSVFPYAVESTSAEAGFEQPFTPCDLGDDVTFGSFPDDKAANVRNAYFNAIHESDRQLGRLVDSLEKLEILDDAILVVAGKNGEAFQLQGNNGHTLQPVESALHVAAVFHAPKYTNASIEDYPIEHVDIVPTVLGMMNWQAHPNFQGIDALADDRESAKKRLLFFHVINGGTRSDAVLFGGRWKYVLNHTLGCGKLFDVKKDPRETSDVTKEQEKLAEYLDKTLEQWRDQQLAFYHYPTYYTKAFPPKSPTWDLMKKVVAESHVEEETQTVSTSGDSI